MGWQKRSEGENRRKSRSATKYNKEKSGKRQGNSEKVKGKKNKLIKDGREKNIHTDHDGPGSLT